MTYATERQVVINYLRLIRAIKKELIDDFLDNKKSREYVKLDAMRTYAQSCYRVLVFNLGRKKLGKKIIKFYEKEFQEKFHPHF